MTHPAERRTPRDPHRENPFPAPQAPTLEEAKYLQHRAAMGRLIADHSGAPTLGYRDLVSITGPMLPGSLWVVLARKKMGKTTFLMNVANGWLQKGIGFAYFGTEETADTALLRFAAIRTGNAPGAVVGGEWEQLGDRQPYDPKGSLLAAQIELAEEMAELAHQPVYFAPDTRPSTGDLRRVANEAKELGLPILVLDHFHRMAQTDLANQTASLAESVRQIKELAVKTGLIIVMAAQAKRASDPTQQFNPPPSDGGMGTSALEQECDVSVGLFKPMRPLPKKESNRLMREYLAGEVELSEILMPNTMGVRVLDHRRNGDLAGRSCFLYHDRGMLASRLLPMPTYERGDEA